MNKPPNRIIRRGTGLGDLSTFKLAERGELDQPAPVIAPPATGVAAPPTMSAGQATGTGIPTRKTQPGNCYYNASALSGDGINSVWPVLIENPMRKTLQIQANLNYTIWIIYNQYSPGYYTHLPEQGAIELQPGAYYEPFICPINYISIFCINTTGPAPVPAGSLICRFTDGQ
jgi:hypothetical protein